MTGPDDLIAQARARRIEDVAAARGIRLRGGANKSGPCPLCGGVDRFGLSVAKQLFVCRHCNVGGDVIALVAFLDGCGFMDAVATLTNTAMPKRTGAATTSASKSSRGNNDDGGTARALKWWNEAKPIKDTVAEQYFVSERGIREMPPEVDEVLRFHPHCVFGTDPQTSEWIIRPCMLALIRDVMTDRPIAVQRTAISTCAEKLGRMAMGPTAGGAIKLWPNDRVELGLCVGEGVETVLAAAQIVHRGTLLQPAWALIDAGHIETFPVLPGIQALTILVDNDKNGVGPGAARACLARWIAAGREVEVLVPNTIGHDFNDIAADAR